MRNGLAVGVTFTEARLADEARVDLETIFHAQYKRMCRVIARVLRDPARAEELAVEVFLKWSRHPKAQGDNAEGWLYRTAVREALDELRRLTHRARYERLFALIPSVKTQPPTPEDVRAVREDQEAVRSEGFTYDELAGRLSLSQGTDVKSLVLNPR